MPRRTDIHTILIIGSGPIVIGQGCEFDYSGVQACRAIREEGYRVVLVNSNPATIMTDPEFADATYIEPITPEGVEKILKLEKEKGTPIDALLPTLGGQTGLNTGMACFDKGILEKYGVKMIGANREAIFRGEDRQRFKDLMIEIGLKVPRSGVVHNMDEARKVLEDIGLPLIIRPAFTLGGTGGGIAYNREEFETIVARGLDASPVTEVLIEQSVIGWKEFEMEVMRDRNDNVVIICSIENLDPMGVHTGDSITVAPIQTLTDKEYQRMRDASIAVIRAVGVETGGSNIQFAINPDNGEMVVVEMNPRVSRSSALASKATGYPIAKLAAKLAVGYTLDELANDITSVKVTPKSDEATKRRSDGGAEGAGSAGLDPSSLRRSVASSLSSESSTRDKYSQYTSACFEPTIDYCVIKIPRWTFEKFPDADETLTTQMKSVGEAMAIGRTFKEALQKGIRSMEVKRFGFGLDRYDKWLKAQRATGGTGILPVSAAAGVEKPGSSEAGRPSHGQDARATGASALPPSARAETDGPDDASDKTTQGESADHEWPIPEAKLRRKLAVPSQGRIYYIRYALKMGWTIEQIYELTKIDRWFLAQMKELVDFEGSPEEAAVHWSYRNTRPDVFAKVLRAAKEFGYSDVQLAQIWGCSPAEVRQARKAAGVTPVYKLVDTCAAEFEAYTPYYYSTYEQPYVQLTTDNGQRTVSEDEIRLSDRPKVIIIGGGPNRIGQGIEFDYCCVQAAFAMRELGIESVMINSNPETVSTDYDTSDLLFFEPLTHEDVLNICERLNGGPFTKSDEATKRRSDEGADKAGSPSPHLPTTPSRNLVKGVIVQFGGQTPLNLAKSLKEAGVPIIGTSVESIDAAGDREQFRTLLQKLGLRQPENGIARNAAEARKIAAEIGYPVLVRPSFVLGGRAMEIVYDEAQLNYYMTHAVEAAGTGAEQKMENPILIDRFLDNATEVDVDCLADYEPYGEETVQSSSLPIDSSQVEQAIASALRTEIGGEASADLRVSLDRATGNVTVTRGGQEIPLSALGRHAAQAAKEAMLQIMRRSEAGGPATVAVSTAGARAIIIGVMEHIEEAGIHSGDSACALPPYSLSKEMVEKLKDETRALARALRVRGLMNVQYAIKDGEIYVIEVNPRASRTVPFVGKATGVPWAKIAAKVMAGKSLAELGVTQDLPDPQHVSVKEVVFPFGKFPGVDVILGPEMRSTGEVMGIDKNFPLAFAKSQIAAGGALPTRGRIYVSVNDRDKAHVVPIAKDLVACGFELISTGGTHAVLAKNDVPATRIPKLAEGRPNIADFIKNGQVQLIINTPTRKGPKTDEGKIRAMAILQRVPIITTITGARAAAQAIKALQAGDWTVRPLQEYHGGSR